MLDRLAPLVALPVASVLGYAATRPDAPPDGFRIERSVVVEAPPEAAYALVQDLAAWPQWSPWEKRDPAMQRTLGPTTAGPGAHCEWRGNREVGHGRMEIVRATPPSQLSIRVDFYEPLPARNTAEFRFVREGDATRITWSVYGPSPYASKPMGLVFDVDKMVGADVEAGLANLKTAAER